MVKGILIEYLSKIDTRAILPQNQVINLLEKILEIYKFNNVIIETSNEELIARFLNGNKLIFNNNRIISLAYLESQNIHVENSTKIKYINFRLFQILLHEVQHILEEKYSNDLLIICEKQENTLKDKGTYSKREYLSNPIERIAEINSNEIIIDVLNNVHDNSVSNIFLNNKLYCELQGYFIDEYKYPLNYFFNKNIPSFDKVYDNIIIGDTINYDEYSNTLNQYRLVRR